MRILEGEQMTVKDYYEVIRDIDRLAEVVDAEGEIGRASCRERV